MSLLIRNVPGRHGDSEAGEPAAVPTLLVSSNTSGATYICCTEPYFCSVLGM